MNINIHASHFTGNTASVNGDDIYNTEGSVNVHSSCPSPYSANTPTQGNALATFGTVGGSAFSYSCFYFCSPGYYNPTLGDSSFSCQTCPSDKASMEGALYCAYVAWQATTMDILYNKVSKEGNSLMTNGDAAVLSEATYTCGSSSCHDSTKMIWTYNLFGTIECTVDSAGCILDGESTRQVMQVYGTGGTGLTLRALRFQNGQAGSGGGVLVWGGEVDVIVCVFTSCKASDSR